MFLRTDEKRGRERREKIERERGERGFSYSLRGSEFNSIRNLIFWKRTSELMLSSDSQKVSLRDQLSNFHQSSSGKINEENTCLLDDQSLMIRLSLCMSRNEREERSLREREREELSLEERLEMRFPLWPYLMEQQGCFKEKASLPLHSYTTRLLMNEM